MGGKVLVPTQDAVQASGRRAAGRRRDGRADDRRSRAPTPTAPSCSPATSTSATTPFLTGERTAEGFYRVRGGLDQAIARGLAYAPYADLIWCETSEPDLDEARRFAEAIHARFPGKLLAYNCSPSFNWKKKLDDATIATFQRELGAHGLQVPVRHAGRLPRAQLQHVRAGARLPRARHGGLLRAAAGGVRRRERRLHAPPSTSARSAPATSTRWRR